MELNHPISALRPIGRIGFEYQINPAGPTEVFAKAGFDDVASTMCKHEQWVGLDVQFSAAVLKFNNIFSNGRLFRAGQSMNSQPSQIPGRWR